MAEHFDDGKLEAAVRDIAGPPRTPPIFVPTQSGKYNTSYFVDGWARPMVLRVAPPDDPLFHLFYEYRMMRQEPGIHALVRERRAAPVAEVMGYAEAHPALGRDAIAMERLPGGAISARRMTRAMFRKVLRQVGECLARTHAITGETYGYIGPHRPMEPQKEWDSAFRIMWNRLLDDIERCGGYSAQEASMMREHLDRRLEHFRHRPAPCLLHMDVWAENILCDDEGKLTGLIDWDRGLWGDPEIEFAVLDYCGTSEEPFWEGYGKERDTSPEARIRHGFYLLYELQKYIFIRKVRSGSSKGADAYRRQALEMAANLFT